MRIPSQLHRRLLLTLGAMALAMQLVPVAHAQVGNGRPVRIIVPFTAGSQTDVVARMISRPMADYLKQTVVVDNRPGATGTIGAQSLLADPADGATLLFVSSAFAVLPSSGLRLPYDPVRDVQALSIVARSPTVLFASKASGFKTTAELVAAAKAKPGSLNFASSGIGSGTHLNAEYLANAAGFQATHIPYKGGRDMLAEVVANRVDFAFLPASDLVGFGPDKLTMLGVSGKQRIRLAPDVAPIAESGLPGFEYFLWQALLLKAQTPQPAVDRMASAVAYALADPAVAKGFQDLGIDAMKLDVNGSRQFVSDEMAKTSALVRSRGLKLSE